MEQKSCISLFIERLASIVVEISEKNEFVIDEWGMLPKCKKFWTWTEEEKEFYEWIVENDRYQSKKEYEQKNEVLRGINHREVMRQRYLAC